MKIIICKHCKNQLMYLNDSSVNVVCCNEIMQELKPNTTDAAVEKHIPIVSVSNNIAEVNVSSVDHPMTKEHYIDYILVRTNKQIKIEKTKDYELAKAHFLLDSDEVILEVYEYCNLHGLWKNN